MVQRTGVEGISQTGRATQGVKVMNIKDDDRVSAVALVVESEDNSAPTDVPADQPELEAGAEPSADDNGASPDAASDDE
jgi:DNA gyrase subunit A